MVFESRVGKVLLAGRYIVNLTIFPIILSLLIAGSRPVFAQGISPKMALEAGGIGDQDDMCIFIHPNPSQSTIIAADKDTNKLFVYDLDGNTIQDVNVTGRPGNIDIRYNFLLSGESIDIVAFADRDQVEIDIYKVNAGNRQLEFLSSFDAGDWPNEIYGFCLYQSPISGKFYAIASGKSSQMRQWELQDDGNGGITGKEMRTWSNGGDKTEGLVADDESGILFAANEGEGIYSYNAEPEEQNPARNAIAETGKNGLTADVEGIAIYYMAGGEGYLLASSQGSDDFKVFDRKPPHQFITSFSVSGVNGTDGIDVTNVNFGGRFPNGIFLCHNDENSVKEIQACDFADVGLSIDTEYWNPRSGGVSALGDFERSLPLGFLLDQNFPNPFNPSTTIRYTLSFAEDVRLAIYDVAGRKITTLVEGFQAAGEYAAEWQALDDNGRQLPSGIYFARLENGDVSQTIKMALTE